MKLLKIALLLVSLPFLALGGEGIYYAARDRQQTTLTCEQFMRQPPRARWLRVTGCDIDYLHAGYRESQNAIAELFFPMRPPSQPPSAPVSLVVATRDPQVLAVAQQTLGNNQQPEQEAYLVMMLRIVTILRAAKEIDGYARSGIVERLETRRALAGLMAPLAPGVVLLDLHARPSFVVPGIEAGAGLLLLLVAIALRARRTAVVPEPVSAPAPAPATVAPAAPPGDVPRPVLERRLPPLMLLKLDPSASAHELEYAPPLGSQQEVTARISGVLGPLTGAGSGTYAVGGPDWTLEFRLGLDEPVWTVTVDARGSDEAVESLERLVRETGWRVFVPRLGGFVAADDLRKPAVTDIGSVRL